MTESGHEDFMSMSVVEYSSHEEVMRESVPPADDDQMRLSEDGCIAEINSHDSEPNDGLEQSIDVSPEVNEDSAPHISIGMEFLEHNDAWMLYLAYAKWKGFGVRKHTTYKSKSTGETICRTYVCAKEGRKESVKKGNEIRVGHNKRDSRCNCKAKMRITMDQKRRIWRVTSFDDFHTHDFLPPSKVLYHRSHRRCHHCPVVMHHVNGVSNLGTNKVIGVGTTVMEDQMIAPCQDDKGKEYSKIMSEYVSVIRQIEEKRSVDPMFFFAVQLDDDKTFRSVFWADGRSRSSYLNFGDVVCFDGTYQTKDFVMPFAPFTGVNHHMQSTLFGCAILADETEKTFVWLFNQWLKCMYNKAPRCIISYQDDGICNAIKKVFPNTQHRYCSWHMQKLATQYLGLRRPINRPFASDYQEWLNSENIVESKSRWESLVSKYKLEKDNWLVKMYENRHHWVPAYMKNVFTAGIDSSHRSESMNSFFDGFIHSQTPLDAFVDQYDKALLARRRAEKDEDFATLNSKQDCESGIKWETQAAMCYTRKMYSIFQIEFKASQAYYKEKVTKDASKAKYLVGKDETEKSKWKTVVLEVSEGVTLTCSCAKFETEGILCRHIMAIMRLKQVKEIPEQYILKRWTMDACKWVSGANTSIACTRQVSNDDNDSTSVMLLSLQLKHHKVLEEATSSFQILNEYERCLNQILDKVKATNVGSSS